MRGDATLDQGNNQTPANNATDTEYKKFAPSGNRTLKANDYISIEGSNNKIIVMTVREIQKVQGLR